ncbi:MAG TPA: neocarzinostatin apoprotein domain-containing protein [Acidimicrobiales bacterium]|nr:neocarzinostatin apoprotein domain-containing protein [Acidimicrobiales bacterium]
MATATAVVAPDHAAQAAPAMTVDPATGLVDGDRVTITASGLPPGSWVEAGQCVSAPGDAYRDCDVSDGAFAIVGADGTATMALRVDAVLTAGFGAGTSREVDCRQEACTIALWGDAATPLVSNALGFVADAPLAPPPTLSVTPDTGLHDLASVTVEAAGLVWSDSAVVMQCAADPVDEDDCDYATAASVAVTAAGELDLDQVVLATIETFNRGPVDCREPGSCVLAVSSDYLRSPSKTATAALTFDPDAEVVVPSLAVSPGTGLVDGQIVSVTGDDFPPSGAGGSWVEISQCTAEASWDSCQWVGWSAVDAGGAVAADVPVWAILSTPAGEVDCRTSAEPCQLVASRGAPDSERAGRADLDFAEDGPLLPPPTIEVTPSTGLSGGDVVTVDGTGFTPSGYAFVSLCERGSTDRCDWESALWPDVSSSGTFTVDLTVEESFEAWDGGVDCVAGACMVAAADEVRRRTATADVEFASPAGGQQRYVDPVFDEVEVTEGIVYRETHDAHGAPVQLTLDLYQPAGDTAEQRPVIAWFRGGWFGSDDGGIARSYADAFARRGYVVAVVDHRARPDLGCCPTRDALGVSEAIADATDDGASAVAWLRDHAGDHRLDPRALVAGGTEGGGAVSFGLAYPGQGRGRPGGHGGGGTHGAMDMDAGPAVAAALPVSGVAVGEPAAGAPPVLAFHGGADLTAPAHLSEWTCTAARKVDDRCDVVAYAGAGSQISVSRQRDIVRRSTAFLAETVLGPLGYLDGDPPSTTTTTAHGPAAPGDPSTTTTTAAGPRGDLPRTGADGTLPLARIGAAATVAGAALVALSVRRRRRTDVAGTQEG